MGPNEMIPIMGMITGTIMTAFFIIGGVMVFRGPVGQALARRIQGKHGDVEQELIGEVQALRDHVVSLEQTVGELEDRLDFNERLLAQGRDIGAAQSGSPRQS
ncbi:MAG: hypothetical protein KJZ47_03535 [Gemmatimonadales bacterium]|nr:hypothetical protein [Gemmatimonadales bacterium]